MIIFLVFIPKKLRHMIIFWKIFYEFLKKKNLSPIHPERNRQEIKNMWISKINWRGSQFSRSRIKNIVIIICLKIINEIVFQNKIGSKDDLKWINYFKMKAYCHDAYIYLNILIIQVYSAPIRKKRMKSKNYINNLQRKPTIYKL
jgi:hypothetical protein